MAQFSEHDHILLNSYLDGQLDAAERAAFESRLAADFALRVELDQLRETIGLLKMAERVPVPRSFTLDPATYGKPARRSFWDSLGFTMPRWAVATASLVVVVLCIGALIMGRGSGGSPASVANFVAPMPAAATEAAAESFPEMASVAQATEAPAPTEAGTEEAPAPTEAATEAPTEVALFAVSPASETASGKSAPPQAGAMTAPGGMGGGMDSAGGAAASGPVDGGNSETPLPLPLPTSAAQPEPTQLAPGVADTQSDRAGNLLSEQAGASRNMTSPGVTPELYATIEVTEAKPWDNLEPGSWTILLGGTGLLIALVLGVTFLMRRRH